MKKYGLVIALLISSGAFASKNSSIEGTYECVGNEVGTQAEFKCQMMIKKTGETYALTANCSDNTSYLGTGIYNKYEHILSTGFINPNNSEETGVSVTKVRKDRNLLSVWTYLGKTTTARTKCFRQTSKV